MATVDNGKQELTFDYFNDAKAINFNQINYGLQTPGVYSGGTLILISNTEVEVEPLICFVQDSEKGIGVNLKTNENAVVSIQGSTPFIILRFDWLNLESNYADIIAVSSTDLRNDDLILGRAIFTGSVLEGFEYTLKSEPVIVGIEEKPLLVTPNLLYDDKVQVNAGMVIFNGTPVEYAGGQSPAFTFPVTDGRKDIVCLDSTGAIVIIQGTDSATPTAPALSSGQEFLALITFPAGATVVRGDYVQSYSPIRNNYT